MTSTDEKRPGRKRSEDTRRSILGAALELVSEGGYASLSIEGIAARAGASKQTVYRWWPSKADVLLDAIATKAELAITTDDTGSFAGDVRSFVTESIAVGAHDQVRRVLRILMAQAQIDEEFAVRFREGFLDRRRIALKSIIDRARSHGDLDSALSPDTMCDIVFGTFWYQILVTDGDFDDDLADQLAFAVTGRP
ncbi:TetR/AcrR family transcriptional regulator [Antrihabitans cavernicola]|uniref:TetR/AcrR family transcriptional regulator n=1 Tax=Antrihabitans cavernicola TaxID=2495913 RepID=A0A5A7SAL9_9NOCA|nr:TetR/AcrR family transcriptional regulator [Spelaeibacter cavernicola]KAA0021603.1 TetR/AcrR family transcriptional regulator [Spelaeibacter cavernicola]